MAVIVTGGSKGIGKAVAMSFAQAGHSLILCARDQAKLVEAKNEINQLYPQSVVNIYAANLALKEEVRAFADFCLAMGTPAVLVNNAGVYLPGNCIDEEEGAMELMMSTNFFSAYYLTRLIVPTMMAAKKGHIFNICSVASLEAYDGGGGYSISKFALNGFSQNLRHELMPYGIKVTAVFPGAVLTNSWGNFDNSDGRIMEATDVAAMIYASSQLSPQAVVEDIILRPLFGDL